MNYGIELQDLTITNEQLFALVHDIPSDPTTSKPKIIGLLTLLHRMQEIKGALNGETQVDVQASIKKIKQLLNQSCQLATQPTFIDERNRFLIDQDKIYIMTKQGKTLGRMNIRHCKLVDGNIIQLNEKEIKGNLFFRLI